MSDRIRRAEALLALARSEDAKDASLPRCKLCGGRAVRIKVGPDCSMHSGWHTIRCERGDQEMTLRPEQMVVDHLSGETGAGKNDRFLLFDDGDASAALPEPQFANRPAWLFQAPARHLARRR